MNIYSQLLKQLNMCGHAVLVTDYPALDTIDGAPASATPAGDRPTIRKTRWLLAIKPFRLFLVLLLLVLLPVAHCLPLIPHWPRLPSQKVILSWTGIMGISACWNHLAEKNGF